jgi:hypothetical protein
VRPVNPRASISMYSVLASHGRVVISEKKQNDVNIEVSYVRSPKGDVKRHWKEPSLADMPRLTMYLSIHDIRGHKELKKKSAICHE